MKPPKAATSHSLVAPASLPAQGKAKPTPSVSVDLAALTDYVDRFSTKTVVVLGDFVADEFQFGEISRVSREAPVLILRHRETQFVPGGGANAANNLAALGARVLPITAVGQDAAGDADKFPPFAFIEPAYMQPGANDAHPPHDIISADGLIASVYNAIRKNDKLWSTTLLLVLFDEHGGFYDHVEPPAAVPPDHHSEEYDFTRYGVRVPALLISPYVGAGIFSDLLDHTSLLRYLQDKWSLNDLGDRTAKANTFKEVINGAASRADTPARVDSSTQTVAASPPVDALNEHQNALVAMSHNLESMTDEDPNLVAARSRHVLTGPQSQIDTAVDRVDNFISQQKATVESWIK